MKKKIFFSIVSIAIVTLFAAGAVFLWFLSGYMEKLQIQTLDSQSVLVAQGVEDCGISYLDSLPQEEFRITWISADGTVLFDSSGTGTSENHLEREEIQKALQTGKGESIRYSTTMLQRSVYIARKLSNGSVIRISQIHSTIAALFIHLLAPILLIAAGAVVFSFWMASVLSKSIVDPIKKSDLENPAKAHHYEELQPLMNRLETANEEISRQSHQLHQKQKELEAVVNGMSEGFVLLSPDLSVISYNKAAIALFQLHPDAKTGLSVQDFGWRVLNMIKGDGSESSREITMDKFGRSLQLRLSPVKSKGKLYAWVLLILDVTEKEQAASLRREFSANVSHELKTPLHAISGSAELMTNRMVKDEDIPVFSKRIYDESQRLIRLVEDILKLSRLDEQADRMQKEPVDLFAKAKEVIGQIEPMAQKYDVAVHLEGEQVWISGIGQFVHSIIYNLCSNAIKYNRKGGSVDISVWKSGSNAVLKVKDTGVGISKEAQERIFERFYRVDTSHSKAIGGTGLGLSIVKHAARLHDARILLDSTPGEGTEFTIVFPLLKLQDLHS
jgi:two-component system phosphate regulon sensor histidine kinase PhoR